MSFRVGAAQKQTSENRFDPSKQTIDRTFSSFLTESLQEQTTATELETITNSDSVKKING